MRSSGYLRGAVAIALCRLVAIPGCGGLGLPSIALNDNVNEEDACLDVWSLVHFESGYYLGSELSGDTFGPTLALVTAYEVAEPHFWPLWNESEVNQQCDIVVGMGGWLAQSLIDE